MDRHCLTSWRWRTAVLTLGIVTAFALLGCSTPEQRYRVLSVFFDGVPDPNAPKGGPIGQKASGRITFVHKPYQDQLCNSCHLNSADIFARAQVRPDVCLDCHASTPSQHAVMHGPVVNNACQMCHSPHSSANPHLLRQPSPAVCTQCHEPAIVTQMHKLPLDPRQSCIECHSGHGGTDHRLLLASAPISTTQPAPQGERQVPR
jgi:predicted CXXCH cytochrome family protein